MKSRAQRLGVQIFGRDWVHGGAQRSEVLAGADGGRRLGQEVPLQEEEAQVGGGRGAAGAATAEVNRFERGVGVAVSNRRA